MKKLKHSYSSIIIVILLLLAVKIWASMLFRPANSEQNEIANQTELFDNPGGSIIGKINQSTGVEILEEKQIPVPHKNNKSALQNEIWVKVNLTGWIKKSNLKNNRSTVILTH
ncbi:hypothetical protein HY745_10425 [Candidatus Desantisbacteria bacterium]|nr:hypothetical protein [Candidatus Desantisbacteria bacterium]